jgi:quercetin 2,3-dioxygenase
MDNIRKVKKVWMTAGSGIVHQEMPKGDNSGLMWGFQLWANLPSSHKMMTPRYRDVKRTQVPEFALENGAQVKIVCGEDFSLRAIPYHLLTPSRTSNRSGCCTSR